MGSGCGSVGIAVASNTRGLQLESSQRQTLYCLYTVKRIEKTKKEAGNGPILKSLIFVIRNDVSIN